MTTAFVESQVGSRSPSEVHVTMPWRGDDEALLEDGPWTPSVEVEPPGGCP